MALTLGEILELDIFRRAEADVVAGVRHLDRPVRWVHVTELPDIAYLLKGGELLLTSGIGLDGGPGVQRRCVRELAEVGAAGLVVELVRVFREELPSALVEEAEKCGLPLVALRRETRFVDITEQVHSAIISRQLQLLKKAESIGRSFTELVLRGAGLRRILHRLAGIVQNPVVLEDAAHQVVELVAHGRPAEVVFSRWERHSRAGHEEHGRGFVTMERGTLNCAWASIWLREERWGRVHVLEFGQSVDEMDRLALDRAVAALGLSLLVERNTEYLADHAGTALISDILQERYESTQEIFHRASSLGVNLAPERRLAAFVVEPLGLSEVAMERRLTEKERQALRASILTDVRRAMQRDGRNGLAALQGEQVLGVVGIAQEQDLAAPLERLGQDIRETIGSRFPEIEAVVGFSAETSPEALRRAFEQAGEAARYGAKLQRRGGAYHFKDLGLHRFLLRLEEEGELARYVESELQPLLIHDAEARTPLLPTLRAYLECGGRKSPAARALHIERRTLYHRLSRLQEVLSCDLDNDDMRVQLSLAVRGFQLLAHRARA